MKQIALIVCLLFIPGLRAGATTWFPAEHTCPVCKLKHEYQEIGSYGGYIYQWPSKYQYVFWPLTDFPSVYCCPECLFSVYMWDFDSIPSGKTDTIAMFLKTVSLDKKYEDYFDIPMTTRLEIAGNIYKILGRDNEFWCSFYRVSGYHYDRENYPEKARESRLMSLHYAGLMLSDTACRGQEKEIYIVMAAMNFFTGQKDSALACLDRAALLTYKNSRWKEESANGLDNYLTDLITQYREFIRREDEK